MDVSLPLTEGVTPSRPDAAHSKVEIPQYRRRAILAVWAAAALPMAALAWLVADRLLGEGNLPMAQALLACLTVGLVWQFVLVAVLVWREQRTLRWSTLREALWLRSPQSPRSGRVAGRVWLILILLVVAFGAEELISLPGPAARDMGLFLESDAGQSFLSGNWAWFGVIAVQLLFVSVLGEELLFRGFLLPRMNGAFGRADWVANGVLFAIYHLHIPWAIPTALLDTLILSYPTKRLPERLDRDRRAQRPERVHRRPRPHARPLRKLPQTHGLVPGGRLVIAGASAAPRSTPGSPNSSSTPSRTSSWRCGCVS
jgi:membrane protease YdiL (CAAX protease family)